MSENHFSAGKGKKIATATCQKNLEADHDVDASVFINFLSDMKRDALNECALLRKKKEWARCLKKCIGL